MGITGRAAKTPRLMVNFWDFSYIVCICLLISDWWERLGWKGAPFLSIECSSGMFLMPTTYCHPHQDGEFPAEGLLQGWYWNCCFSMKDLPHPYTYQVRLSQLLFILKASESWSSPHRLGSRLKDPPPTPTPPTAPSCQEGRSAGLPSHYLLRKSWRDLLPVREWQIGPSFYLVCAQKYLVIIRYFARI